MSSQSSPGRVAIFWHYDNLRPNPKNKEHSPTAYDALDTIRQSVEKFGITTSFKAYLDIASTPVDTRWELQACGVSVVDCGYTVSETMIAADMLSFAMDNPALGTTIVLISGSLNLAYPMSVLRMRKYHLVLISPLEKTDRHLKYQATEFIELKIPVGGEKSMAGPGWSGGATHWRDEWSEGSVQSSSSNAEIEKQDLDTVTPASSPSGSSQPSVGEVMSRIIPSLRAASPTPPPQYMKDHHTSAAEPTPPPASAISPQPAPTTTEIPTPPRPWRNSVLAKSPPTSTSPSPISIPTTPSNPDANTTPTAPPRNTNLDVKAHPFTPVLPPKPYERGVQAPDPEFRASSRITIRAPQGQTYDPPRRNAVPIEAPAPLITSSSSTIYNPPIPTPPLPTSTSQPQAQPPGSQYTPVQLAALKDMVKVLADLRNKGQKRSNPGQVAPLVLERNRRVFEMADVPNRRFGRLIEMAVEVGWVEVGPRKDWIAVGKGWSGVEGSAGSAGGGGSSRGSFQGRSNTVGGRR